jgi:hypothetical protein
MKRLRCGSSALVILAISLAAGTVQGSDPSDAGRLNRRIESMEKTLDHLMLDSPNFLVQRGRNAHGLYVPDYGVILTFNAQINAHDALFEVVEDDGDRVIIRHGKGSHYHGNRTVLRLLGITVDRGHHDESDDPVAAYQEGKKELVEMLLDHAGTLASLPAGQWIVMSGHIDNETLREEKDISRLVLRVRTDDLKAYADKRLSDEEATARILVEES